MTLVEHGHDISGTTAQRPTNVEIGQRYFDTDINTLMVYNGSAWQDAADSGGSIDIADAVDLVFGTGDDAVVRWSTGDASNHSLAVGLGDTNQALHITDKAAIATDWNVSADTHPTLYIHSNTTPATDYMTVGAHDGTTGHVNVVGGTTLSLDIGGTAEATLSASVLDLASTDLQMQASGQILDNNGNELIEFLETASAVNGLRVVNAATGNLPIITNEGEADTGMILAGYDGTNTEEIVILDAIASAVNEFTVKNAATGGDPEISVTGDDTNINLKLTPKGAGLVVVNGPLQVRDSDAVTATAGGGTTGLIPAGSSFVVVTSDNATKQISLPAASVGDRIRILVGATGCELISAVATHKVNNVTVGATNEAALTATNMYDCQYLATDTWIVIGYTNLGAVQAALVPDAL